MRTGSRVRTRLQVLDREAVCITGLAAAGVPAVGVGADVGAGERVGACKRACEAHPSSGAAHLSHSRSPRAWCMATTSRSSTLRSLRRLNQPGLRQVSAASSPMPLIWKWRIWRRRPAPDLYLNMSVPLHNTAMTPARPMSEGGACAGTSAAAALSTV